MVCKAENKDVILLYVIITSYEESGRISDLATSRRNNAVVILKTVNYSICCNYNTYKSINKLILQCFLFEFINKISLHEDFPIVIQNWFVKTDIHFKWNHNTWNMSSCRLYLYVPVFNVTVSLGFPSAIAANIYIIIFFSLHLHYHQFNVLPVLFSEISNVEWLRQ